MVKPTQKKIFQLVPTIYFCLSFLFFVLRRFVECKYLTQLQEIWINLVYCWISRWNMKLVKKTLQFDQLTWQANGVVEHHIKWGTFTNHFERTITSFDVIWTVHVVATIHAQRHKILLHWWFYRHRKNLQLNQKRMFL